MTGYTGPMKKPDREERCHFTDEGTLEQCSLQTNHHGEHIFPFQLKAELLADIAEQRKKLDAPPR